MSLWRRIAAKFSATETDDVRMDGMTNALLSMVYEHHEIHEGNSFSTGATDETMSDTDTLILAFKTPSGTKRAHMIFEFATLVGGKLEGFEAPTWTTSTGSQQPIFNRKREASMNSSILLEDTAGSFSATDNVVLNPTGLSGGTLIGQSFAWGEKGKIGAESRRGVGEWILKPDTAYAVVFTAIGDSNKASMSLHWYEHTDIH